MKTVRLFEEGRLIKTKYELKTELLNIRQYSSGIISNVNGSEVKVKFTSNNVFGVVEDAVSSVEIKYLQHDLILNYNKELDYDLMIVKHKLNDFNVENLDTSIGYGGIKYVKLTDVIDLINYDNLKFIETLETVTFYDDMYNEDITELTINSELIYNTHISDIITKFANLTGIWYDFK